MSNPVNFIEAVNSGKRFRHVNWSKSIDGDGWYRWHENGLFYWSDGASESQKITTQFLNYNYNLEEKTITITESQFDKAFSEHAKLDSYFHYTSKRMGWIKKELGFSNDK